MKNLNHHCLLPTPVGALADLCIQLRDCTGNYGSALPGSGVEYEESMFVLLECGLDDVASAVKAAENRVQEMLELISLPMNAGCECGPSRLRSLIE